MKIITWNLNHRTLEKPISDEALRFFEDFNADLIVLNEYVDGESRGLFKARLFEIGYMYQLLSPRIGNNNQIFIASKFPISQGDLSPPTLTDAAITNFLHIKIDDTEIELVGLRAPSYKLSSERTAYWKELTWIMRSANKRKIVFVGDINYDPFVGVDASTLSIKFGLAEGFYIPNPKGDWSYISPDGKSLSRIDHAIWAEGLTASDVEYMNSYHAINLAGPKDMNAITDHAALSFSIRV